MKIAIYTANFGGKDILRPPTEFKDELDIDYYYFSDCKPTHDIYPYKFLHRPLLFSKYVLNARRLKILGDSALDNYDILIWHDANMQIVENQIDAFVSKAQNHMLSMHRHPDRNDVYSEAMSCIRVGKSSAFTLLKQIWSYFLKGLPAHFGLYSTGVLIKLNSLKNNAFYEDWWQELSKYSGRDQIALSYIEFKYKNCINAIDGNIYNESFIKYYFHEYQEYRNLNGKVYNDSKIARKLCYILVKMMRKVSKLI